jgi:hypothetical protein
MNNLEASWPGLNAKTWPFGVMLTVVALTTYCAAFFGYYIIMGRGEQVKDIEKKSKA